MLVVMAVVLIEVQPQFGAPLGAVERALLRLGAMLWRGFDVLETWIKTRAPGNPEAKKRKLAIGRGALLAVPLTLVFGGLLVSADAAFQSLVTNAFRWNLNFDGIFSHAVGILCASWIAIGLLSSPGAPNLLRILAPEPPPKLDPAPAKAADGWRIGLTEVTFVLGTLTLLFGAFVGVQVRYLFGGDAQVQSIAGLNYAEYARKGFFELVWVCILALPILLGCGKVALREGPRGHRLFLLLGSLTVGLLVVIMASAWTRMSLYVDAYGLTALRLYVCAAMLWIGGVLGWMLVSHLRRAPALFAPGAATLGILAVLGLNVLNPDRTIAEFNLLRAQRTGNLDGAYLADLSLDAVPAISRSLPRASDSYRESLRAALASMEKRHERRDWRSWTWGQHLAARAIRDSPGKLAKPSPSLEGGG